MARWSYPAWAGIALAFVFLHALLPELYSRMLAAAVLCIAGGVYVGFACIDGRVKPFMLETAAALAFAMFAFWAFLESPLLLPAGYLAHAVWDFLHHNRFFVKTPGWFIPACVVADVVIAAGLWAVWLL